MQRAARRLLTISLGCFLGGSAFAAVNQWTPLGPYVSGGNVLTLAVDPNGVVYAGTNSGLFKTTDGGVSWASTSVGLLNLSIRALAIDPRSPSTIYAVLDSYSPCGLFKSTNGGASWNSASDGLDGICPGAIAIDPQDSSTLYGVSSGVVTRSTDAGVHWSVRGDIGSTGASAIAIDPTHPSTLSVAANVGVFRSTDGGATWSPRIQGLTGTYFGSLLLDPSDPATLYTASEGGAFKTRNAGISWVPLVNGLPAGSVGALALDPASPETVYASVETIDQRQQGVYRSTDGGASWAIWNQRIGSVTAAAFAVGSDSPHTIYLGTSPDTSTVFARAGEEPWQALSTPFQALNVSAITATDARTLYAAAEQAVYKTMDAGAHWTRLTGSLSSSNGFSKLVVRPAAPGMLYAATYAGVFASTDDGASWTDIGPADQAVYSIAVDPQSGDTIYAGTYPQQGTPEAGGIWRTMDGGRSWTQSADVSFDYPISFVIDQSDPATLYAGTHRGVILKSTDSGASWRPVYPEYGAVDSIVIDPRLPNRLAASSNGTTSPLGIPPGHVVFSDDGGETWSMGVGLPCCGIGGLVLDPLTGSLYVGAGLTFTSADHGATWTPIGASGASPALLVRAASGVPTLFGIGAAGVNAMTVAPLAPRGTPRLPRPRPSDHPSRPPRATAF